MREGQTTENTQIFKDVKGMRYKEGPGGDYSDNDIPVQCEFLDLIWKKKRFYWKKMKFDKVCCLADSTLPVLISKFCD